MESTTVSPNGTNNGYAGAAATHTLADPAAERMLDTILATPFAEADPPAELPPAADIAAEEPPAGDPFPMLPPVTETDEPSADPAADPGADAPAEEAKAPAAEAEPEPEAPAAEPASTEPSAEPNADLQERLKTTIAMEYQPNAFAIFRGKPVEITGHSEDDTLFDGHYVTIDKATGRIVEGTKIEKQPTAQLEPLRNATSLLRLRKGLMIRALDVLDAMTLALAKEIEQVDTNLEALAKAKAAIRDLLPSKGKDLVF